MPYLGQNLDRLGVVRVRPNWEPARKKASLPNIPQPSPMISDPRKEEGLIHLKTSFYGNQSTDSA